MLDHVWPKYGQFSLPRHGQKIDQNSLNSNYLADQLANALGVLVNVVVVYFSLNIIYGSLCASGSLKG